MDRPAPRLVIVAFLVLGAAILLLTGHNSGSDGTARPTTPNLVIITPSITTSADASGTVSPSHTAQPTPGSNAATVPAPPREHGSGGDQDACLVAPNGAPDEAVDFHGSNAIGLCTLVLDHGWHRVQSSTAKWTEVCGMLDSAAAGVDLIDVFDKGNLGSGRTTCHALSDAGWGASKLWPYYEDSSLTPDPNGLGLPPDYFS